MGKVDYENQILSIDDKLVDGNQIRSMTDKELRNLIDSIYEIGYEDGFTEGQSRGYEYGYADGYDNGYDEGSTDYCDKD